MRDPTSHRSRRPRRGRLRRSLSHAGSLVAGGLLVGLGIAGFHSVDATDARSAGPAADSSEFARLSAELDAARGALALNQLEIDRLKAVGHYSSHYRVPADVAAKIYDAALAEDIHPSLGFQLVKVESGFRSRARSTANALGYTQVRLPTARMFDSTLTERRLLDPETNLRIGFRILRRLLRQFDHDLELALRAYNLGPTGAVTSLTDTAASTRAAAYAESVMRGVKGKPGGGA